MPRTALLLLTLSFGCASGPRNMDPVPVSAVRTSLLRKVEGLLRKSVEAEGWEVERVETKSDGTVARNSGEAWDENVLTVTFDASKPPAGPVVLGVPDQAAVLANLRVELRKVVTNQDGEASVEGYVVSELAAAFMLPDLFEMITSANLSPSDFGLTMANARVQADCAITKELTLQFGLSIMVSGSNEEDMEIIRASFASEADLAVFAVDKHP